MPDRPIQTYKNHTRLDPPFHFFLAPVALTTVVLAIIHAIRTPSGWNWWLVLLAIAFLVAVFKIRLYALKVQDRVIRLEEELRMARLINDRQRLGDLSVGQIVALRFASDAEFPTLVEKTLVSGWAPKDIKKAIQTWRADFFRV